MGKSRWFNGDIGESIYDTVKREILEETGLEIEDLEIFNIYSGEEQHHIYPSGDESYFVNIIFKTEKYKGKIESLDNESVELRFFDIKDIPDNKITKPFKCVLKDLNKIV